MLGIRDLLSPSSVETTNQTGTKLEYTQRGVVWPTVSRAGNLFAADRRALVASQRSSEEVNAHPHPRPERQSGSELA